METGRFGISRVQAFLNLSFVPFVVFYAKRIQKRPASAILSVVSGTYFLAAALVSSRTKLPLVLIVHDDWVPIIANFIPLPRRFFTALMGFALRKASHIFVVSAGMRQMLRDAYGVDSEIQMPAAESWDLESRPARPPVTCGFCIWAAAFPRRIVWTFCSA